MATLKSHSIEEISLLLLPLINAQSVFDVIQFDVFVYDQQDQLRVS